jgi:hypothetical protein
MAHNSRDRDRAGRPVASGRSPARRRWRLARGLVWLVAVLAVGASAAFGLKSLETHVTASDEAMVAPTSVRVRLSPIPAWMPRSLANHIAAGILDGNAEFNQTSLVQDAYDRLAACPWVRSVDHAKKEHTSDPLVGILEVQATFREPQAVVLLKDGKGYAFVDEEELRLPDEAKVPGAPRWTAKIPPADARTPARLAYYWDKCEVPQGLSPQPIHYILIEGVQADAPPPGQTWQGQDIADGVRLIRLLRDKPYASQVVSVDVRNYGGRVLGNSGKPHISIHARGRNGEPVDVWFGRFPMPHGDYIITAERRLANLDDYLARCGGFFGAHRRVDLQYDKVHVE